MSERQIEPERRCEGREWSASGMSVTSTTLLDTRPFCGRFLPCAFHDEAAQRCGFYNQIGTLQPCVYQHEFRYKIDPVTFFVAGWVRAINKANRRGTTAKRAWDRIELAWQRRKQSRSNTQNSVQPDAGRTT